MGIFYTKKGDKGYSHVGRKKVYKLSPFVVALGELDQLNSLLGVVKSQRTSPPLKKILHQIQEDLFIIQANIAAVMLNSKPEKLSGSRAFTGFKVPKFESYKIAETEKIIDDIEKRLKPARSFVISGTTEISAWLDYIRAFSRSVERSVLLVARDKKHRLVINPDILPYLNRLSSLFFALARWEARNKKEKNPRYK